jgi:hypothetical protein
MRILGCGKEIGHSAWRFNAFKKLGHQCLYLDERKYINESSASLLYKLEFRFKYGFGVEKLNRALIESALEFKPDVVWIDRGLFIYPSTIKSIKSKLDSILIHCNHDDFRYRFYKNSQYDKCIPLYDAHLVTRPVNVEELYEKGAKYVEKIWFSFEPTVHRPLKLNQNEVQLYSTDVTFIGRFEPGRENILYTLFENGLDIKVWGPRWERCKIPKQYQKFFLKRPLFGDAYCKAIYNSKISLGFLSNWMRDQHTCRSIEIPACQGFLLAERTEEHQALFEEGKEAIFYASKEELTDKARYYVERDYERLKIAEAGFVRCHKSGYDHLSRAKHHLALVKQI